MTKKEYNNRLRALRNLYPNGGQRGGRGVKIPDDVRVEALTLLDAGWRIQGSKTEAAKVLPFSPQAMHQWARELGWSKPRPNTKRKVKKSDSTERMDQCPPTATDPPPRRRPPLPDPDPSHVIVTLPSGAKVEGLTMTQACQMLRELGR